MRRILILLVMFLNCLISADAQTAAWDSTYRPNLYQTRLGQFRSFANSSDDIIFLGNSIVAYGNWSELLQDSKVRNRGIPGDISFGVIDRLDEVIEGRPAKLYVLIGINDISRNIPDSVIIHNYMRIIDVTRKGSPGTKIYFHTLLPVNNSFVPFLPHFNKDEHILNVNRQLQELGVNELITVIDLYSAFVTSEGKLDKNYSFDGLHLNDKGYVKWAELIKRAEHSKKRPR